MNPWLDWLLVGSLGLLVAFLAYDTWRRARKPASAEAGPGAPARPSETEASVPDRPTHARLIRATGLFSGTADFAIALILVGAIAFLASLLVVPLLVAVLVGVLAGFVMWLALGYLGQWRINTFEEQLADGIDLLIAALQGGENLPQALAHAAQACPHRRVREELSEIGSRLSLGMAADRAVARILERYDCEGTRLFAATLATKWQAGGEMAPVLLSVNRIIRERVKLRMHLRAQLSGARVSALLGALIPYIILPFYAARRPDWITILLTRWPGPLLLCVAIGLQILGLLWLRRILDMEV